MLHVVPTSPDSWRIVEELEPAPKALQVRLKALQVRLGGVVEKLHELSQSAAGVGA